jgi:16S rRNA (guanine1516-N2)-methyltransferase
MNQDITIGYRGEAQFERAKQLAQLLNLRLDNYAENQLLVLPEKLALKIDHFTPLCADFTSSTWQKRRDAGKKQGLVKACKPASGITIIDATAGWGRDAAVLASFGAQVIMLEREPIMVALLQDALMRRDARSKALLKLELVAMDAFDFLQKLSEENYPDIIYLDPMHPERQKSAFVKKEMQILQQLIQRDEKNLELLQLAKTRAKKRVVLKWPRSLPSLLESDFSIRGNTIRFDVFQIHF